MGHNYIGHNYIWDLHVDVPGVVAVQEPEGDVAADLLQRAPVTARTRLAC